MHCSLEDDAFIKRLATTAALRNNNILSDVEIARAEGLLMQIETSLLQLEHEISPMADHIHLQMQASRLRAAIAPLKRLPEELLREVFLDLIPGGESKTITMPPDVSEIPWMLGHVCSSWRRVSRSMPELWAPIAVAIGDFDSGSEGLGIASIHTSSFPVLFVDTADFLPMFEKIIIPYPGLIPELLWAMSDDEALGQLRNQIRSLPSGSFDRFTFCHLKLDVIRYWRLPNVCLDLFSGILNMKRLSLHSDRLNTILNLDVPWHQLTHLKLCIDPNLSGPQYVPPHIMTHADCMPMLTKLYIGPCSPIIFTPSLPIPWSQLTSLVVAPILANIIPALCLVLQKATALTDVDL
ncbi:hypothetical protein DXG01_002471 [Tephrocybe rancida]|nr:hypothetical protein DXG01_002471 [Tephrocybe rancida]